ncbi:MAG TPA: hypothetical protein VG964_03940 [Candidatus Saccharimonadales bacterium]|nr:hypothetical protein [Candidatus Saccharimonadales bacterium]
MFYTIQHSGGRVGGHFELPDTRLSGEDWARRLGVELWPVLGVNAVRLIQAEEERVIIDMDPLLDADDAVEKAQMAVGMVALTSELEEDRI